MLTNNKLYFFLVLLSVLMFSCAAPKPVNEKNMVNIIVHESKADSRKYEKKIPEKVKSSYNDPEADYIQQKAREAFRELKKHPK